MEFEGWERHRSGRQDTYVKDIYPVQDHRTHPLDSADVDGDDVEHGPRDGEELGWTAVKARNRPRLTYHRFGFQQRHKRW